MEADGEDERRMSYYIADQREERLRECESRVSRSAYEPGRVVKRVSADRHQMCVKLGCSQLFASEFELRAGANVLFGGNGQGKSSLIELLRAFCDIRESSADWALRSKIMRCRAEMSDCRAKFVSFKSSVVSAPSDAFEFSRAMMSAESSVGQTAMRSARDFLDAVDAALSPDEDAIIFIDAIDDGLDAIAARYVGRRLRALSEKLPRAQIVIAANSYELMSQLDEWLNVCTGKQEPAAKGYEEFLERLEKMKRRHRRKKDVTLC